MRKIGQKPFWGSGFGNTKVVVKAVEGTKKVTKITATATGVKQITVTFDAQVPSTDTVKLAVNRGTAAVNTENIAFTDASTAVITTTGKLVKGEYTVTATGAAETDLTSTFSVEDDEYVAAIELLSDKAPLDSTTSTTAKAYYVCKNQYGEAMSSIPTTPTVTASTAGNATPGLYKSGKGTINISGGTNNLVPNTTVYLSIVLTQGTHVATFTGTATLAQPSWVDKLEFAGVYEKYAKDLVSVDAAKLGDSSKAIYSLLFTAKDQYDMPIDADKLVTSDLAVASTYPLFVAIDNPAPYTTIDYKDTTYNALGLSAGTMSSKGGTTTIKFISGKTGATSSYDISSDAASAVKTISINTPADAIAEGEKVEIPYTALDQNGKEVTAYSALNTAHVTTNASSGTFEFEKQANGSAKLYFTAPTNVATATQDYTVYLSAVVIDGGSFSGLSVAVKDTAVPTTVVGIASDSKVAKEMQWDGSQDMKYSDFAIVDQYSRTVKAADVKKWLDKSANNKIVIEHANNSTVDEPLTVTSTGYSSATCAAITTSSQKFTIAAKSYATTRNDSQKLTFGLSFNGANTVKDGSEKKVAFSLGTVTYDSYEAEDLGSAKFDAAKTIKTKVYGVKADGTKVLLPTSSYNISFDSADHTAITASDFTINAGQIKYSDVATTLTAADFVNADGTKKTLTAKFNISIIDSSNGGVAGKIQKTLVISGDGTYPASISYNSAVVTSTASGSSVLYSATIKPIKSGSDYVIGTSVLQGLVKEIKDQYGNVVSTNTVAMTISDIKKDNVNKAFHVASNGTSTANISKCNTGDTFVLQFANIKDTVLVTVGNPSDKSASVTIVTAAAIDASNVNSYAVEGTCNTDASRIVVTVSDGTNKATADAVINGTVWTAYVDCSELTNTSSITVNATAYADNGTSDYDTKTASKETRTVIHAVTASAITVTGTSVATDTTTSAAVIFDKHVNVTFDQENTQYTVSRPEGVFTDKDTNNTLSTNDEVVFTITLTAKDGYAFDASITSINGINSTESSCPVTVTRVNDTQIKIEIKSTVGA